MFRVFQEEKLITICMFAFLGSSILLRVFLGLLYRNMIKEADNMASTKNRLLKQCKTKFASCYQLGNGVANIPVFVDKFLNRMTLGRLSFETIYHLSGQLMLLSVVCSGIGVCKSIIEGRTVGEVLPFYIVSFFGLYVYFSVSTVVDVRGKKRVLKINLVDYLENHLSPRIEVTRQDMEMLYGEAAFEEKRQPYGRIPGGRTGRGRGRKGGKGIQAKPEKRRTVELMPIDNRMAAGGEAFQEEASMGQQYITAQQVSQMQREAAVRGTAQMQREPAVQGMAQMQRESTTQGMAQMQWAAEDAGIPQVQRRTETVKGPQQMTETAGSGTQEEQMLWVEPSRQMTQTDGGGQWRGPEQDQQAGREGQIEQQFRGRQEQQAADAQWATGQQEQQAAGAQWAAGQQNTSAQRTAGDFQMAQGAAFSSGFQAENASPEDSAAVTEEELEALLKEFLTT